MATLSKKGANLAQVFITPKTEFEFGYSIDLQPVLACHLTRLQPTANADRPKPDVNGSVQILIAGKMAIYNYIVLYNF